MFSNIIRICLGVSTALVAACAEVPDQPVATSDPEFAVQGLFQGIGATAYSAAGNAYLAVWAEWDGTSNDFFARRLKPSGAPMDPAPVVLAIDTLSGGRTSVASDGRDFLAVWADRGGLEPTRPARVWGRRIDGLTGKLLGGLIAMDQGGPLSRRDPRVVWNGQRYLVTYVEGDAAGRIAGTMVSATGVVASPQGKTFTTVANASAIDLDVTVLNGEVVMAWVGDGGIRAATIADSGVPRTSRTVDPADLRGPLTVASTGDDVWILGQERFEGADGTFNDALRGMRISRDLLVNKARTTLVDTVDDDGSSALVRRGDGSMTIAWMQHERWAGTKLWQGRLLPVGVISGSFLVTPSVEGKAAPRLATDGGASLVTWLDVRQGTTGGGDLYGAITQASSVTSTDLVIAQ